MKTIVIFTKSPDADDYPFANDYYYHAYFDLLLALKARGAAAYFASGNDNYLGGGVFSRADTADSKVAMPDVVSAENIHADLVFDKGRFEGAGVPVVNPEYVRRITADKAETYRHFARYQPMTVVCESPEALNEAFDDLPGEMIVVKEPISNRGRAVMIGPKSDIISRIPNVFPLIVQEFIDTSVGIKNYVEGIHDVRVKIGGGMIFGGMIRTPAPGELRANLAQGGSARHVSEAELPPEAVRLALELDQFFKDYPRFYALDFANTPTGMKLIELNRMPGLTPISLGPQAGQVTEQLADYLVQLAA